MVKAKRGVFAFFVMAVAVITEGLNPTVLSWLQFRSVEEVHTMGGDAPISFCNVLFMASLIVGLTLVASDYRQVKQDVRTLTPRVGWIFLANAFLANFLAQVAFFYALDYLGVIPVTLMLTLVLPVSSLMSRHFLAEALPNWFWSSFLLILVGITLTVLPNETVYNGAMNDPMLGQTNIVLGYFWASVAVISFSISAVTSRKLALEGLSSSTVAGLGTLFAALLFGAYVVVFFGVEHFVYLKLWWVVGVIGIYSFTLSVGNEWSQQAINEYFSVVTIGLFDMLSVVVAIVAAWLILGTPLTVNLVSGAAVVIAGVLLSQATQIREHFAAQP